MPMGRDDARAAHPVVRAVQRIVSFGRGPYGLVTGFAVLHVAVALSLLPTMLRGGAEGDLPLYREWAQALVGGRGPLFAEPWVYPAGALLPIVLPLLAGRAGYLAVWLVMLTALNAAALLTLTRGLRNRRAYPAAWWFLLFELLLSPVAMLRLEGVTAPLAIIALALVARHPAASGALLAAATWVKVWPAALAASAFVALRRRWALLVGGLTTSAVIVAVVALLGGGGQLTSFLTFQSDRAIQLEAPVSTPWVWGAVLGLEDTFVYWNNDIVTWEVTGPGADQAASAVDAAMIVACAAIAIALVVARLRLRHLGQGVTALEPGLLLLGGYALTLALIVFNKVGSPQYMLWLAPIIVVGIAVSRRAWTRTARWFALVALLTTLVFPIFYSPLIQGEPFAAVLLTVRNALLVGMLVAACVRLVAVAIDPSRLVPRISRAASGPDATARQHSIA